MGANNSKPQTVQMSNSSPFQISREVLERVEKSANANKSAGNGAGGSSTDVAAGAGPATVATCENCQRTKPVNPVHFNSTSEATNSESQAKSWARRSTEVEEMQYSKTLSRVHNLFGQPVKWVKAHKCSSDIENMEKELIACYQQHGSEPLKCASLVKQYQGFVFKKQVAAVQNTKPSLQNLGGTN